VGGIVANFFYSAGYASENIHSGMIAYLCDLWNDGEREPLRSFRAAVLQQYCTIGHYEYMKAYLWKSCYGRAAQNEMVEAVGRAMKRARPPTCLG